MRVLPRLCCRAPRLHAPGVLPAHQPPAPLHAQARQDPAGEPPGGRGLFLGWGVALPCWGAGAPASSPAPPTLKAPASLLQGTLEGLEEELLGFFSVTPQSVYTAMMDNR